MLNKLASLIRPKSKKGIVGIWLDDHDLVVAAKKTRDQGYKKIEAISPFPIHGIDDALGYDFSVIPWVTFTFGSLGCLFGIWFTWWTSSVDYPLIVGGKPFWSLPAFIPVIFETTILFAALSSVGALLYLAGLPKVDPVIIDPDLTSHKFALFIPEDDVGYNAQKVQDLFKSLGASEVRPAEF